MNPILELVNVVNHKEPQKALKFCGTLDLLFLSNPLVVKYIIKYFFFPGLITFGASTTIFSAPVFGSRPPRPADEQPAAHLPIRSLVAILGPLESIRIPADLMFVGDFLGNMNLHMVDLVAKCPMLMRQFIL